MPRRKSKIRVMIVDDHAILRSGLRLLVNAQADMEVVSEASDGEQALQAAGAKHIYLAGRPGEQEAALRAAGVNDFVLAGSDALIVLQEAYRLVEGA